MPEAALTERQCVPCEGGVAPLAPAAIAEYLKQLQCPWEVINNKKIRHEFTFGDFSEAMFFVNEVAATAEAENHHPDMHIYFKKVVIELWTHAIGGLSENDFILASKIEVCDF
ncbi:MAG: 4a-hydroxytetrahydrobiopterin dehydratase [Candidatus Andersenbacteria bacterium]